MNLGSSFQASVSRQPEKPAVFWGEDTFSYADLGRMSSWVAHELLATHRVQRGDRVAIWMKNCPHFIPAFFGILQAGAVVVPINNFLKAEEVEYMLEDGAIDLLFVDESMAEAVAALRARRPGIRLFHAESIQRGVDVPVGGGSIAGGAPAEDDLAVVIYTSGTTGKPKGAMLTHGNLLHNVASCQKELEVVNLDRFALLLPMFHSFMMTVCVLLPLLTGASIVLIRSVSPAKNILHEIITHQATMLPAIPQFFRTLTHLAGQVSLKLPLRLCISGAAPLPLEILREFGERFPFPLIEGYGLSEASPVVSLNPLRGPGKAGSIGIPIANVEVRVCNDTGEPLPDGQVGEICVRGGNVMKGYWNRPEETARSIRDGWLLTGDIGYRDPDGYFFITDRKKDMLLVNGINVYPREIEEVLYRMPGVKEAAVIGKPDPRRGEQPVAFVVAQEGQTIEERAVTEFVREHLADYKVPRHVRFIPALPRNATGKVLKTSLRQLD